MRLPRETYQIQQTIETHLPHLSQPQLTGLALWVCGAILAGSACQNAVASALSPWHKWNNLRQYLREWLYDGSDRKSPCQTQLDVTLCFAPLLRWVLSRWVLAWWYSERLALAIDPTLKGDQTTAIVISVVYRSCAIPVAPYPIRGRLWSIHRATQKGSPYPVRGRLWMDPTVELLRELAPAVPRDMTVIVLCDRGISSPKLWKQIRAQGWHPGMRYRKNVTFCAVGGKRLPALAFVPVPRHRLDRSRRRLRSSNRPAPLHPAGPSGTPSRRNPRVRHGAGSGSSSPTWRPTRWDPAGTPWASGPVSSTG